MFISWTTYDETYNQKTDTSAPTPAYEHMVEQQPRLIPVPADKPRFIRHHGHEAAIRARLLREMQYKK